MLLYSFRSRHAFSGLRFPRQSQGLGLGRCGSQKGNFTLFPFRDESTPRGSLHLRRDRLRYRDVKQFSENIPLMETEPRGSCYESSPVARWPRIYIAAAGEQSLHGSPRHNAGQFRIGPDNWTRRQRTIHVRFARHAQYARPLGANRLGLFARGLEHGGTRCSPR